MGSTPGLDQYEQELVDEQPALAGQGARRPHRLALREHHTAGAPRRAGEPFDDESDDCYWRLQARAGPRAARAGARAALQGLRSCPGPGLDLAHSTLLVAAPLQGFLPGELVEALDHGTLRRMIKAYL